MNAKKLPPSSSPAAFAPASVRSRKIDSGSSGVLRPVLDHEERGQQRRRCREQRDRPRRAPAVLRRLGDRVDQQHQPARAGDRTERVEPPAGGGESAVGHDPGCERQRGGPDRDVQIEDVLPPGVAGEKPAGDHPNGRAAGTEPAPDPERLVALGALGEHVHHDRQGGGQHDRRAEPLNGPRCDERHLAGRQRGSQRRRRKQRKPDHQDPAAAEQVRRTTAEQHEAAERERVRGHHPLQAGRAEVQIATDRGQRDVDDRQIDNRHEERHRQQRERAPAIDIRGCGRHRTSSGRDGDRRLGVGVVLHRCLLLGCCRYDEWEAAIGTRRCCGRAAYA